MTYVTLRWVFRRLLRHHICDKGEGGAWRYTGGGGEGMGRKAPGPHPRTNWGWGLDAVQSFFGAAGGLDAGHPLRAVVPPRGGKGVGEVAALRAQLGVHPLVGIHFGGGGGMTRGKRPRTRGPWRASPSPALSRPLAGQPRPPAAPRASLAFPRAPLPVQRRMCGPPWAPRGPSDQNPILRYVRSEFVHDSAFIIQRPCPAPL